MQKGYTHSLELINSLRMRSMDRQSDKLYLVRMKFVELIRQCSLPLSLFVFVFIFAELLLVLHTCNRTLRCALVEI